MITCKNTDKICIFTNRGQMHLLKVLDLPFGKFRDKGTPMDNLSNYNSSSEEQIVTICDVQQIAFEKLLFATKQGMVKRVDGSEFQVAKRTIPATKLQEEDALLWVSVIRERTADRAADTRRILFAFSGSGNPGKEKGCCRRTWDQIAENR